MLSDFLGRFSPEENKMDLFSIDFENVHYFRFPEATAHYLKFLVLFFGFREVFAARLTLRFCAYVL